jgi:hypothetical protein
VTWNQWIRQIHRWLAIAFTAGFITNLVVVSQGKTPTVWIGLTALGPLILLLLTGLYLFVLPYALRWGGKRAAPAQEAT